ncbi:DNA binding domain, excisionase family [Gottschalkia purinilytica]|uniref:DNA binding domain, excisionase family n=1 Tax=Gottschalkia purinilytica TaxID=1503 RepID=A0A0L0W8G6_GOTPU|nr:helix-turn-helix domain-containing protein [Gottschalkia purinilytica]KNF07839.1 DNA binding domain, excisionase family [Gottschalkia purinilytica]
MDLTKVISEAVENAIVQELGRFNDNMLNIAKAFEKANYELEVYTVKEVASILKVNTNKIYELIDKGLLKGLKLGNMKVIRADLIDFLKKYSGMDLSDLDNIKELKSNI